jgi:hypothetical protein
MKEQSWREEPSSKVFPHPATMQEHRRSVLEEMAGLVMTQLPSGHHITYQLQYRKCGKPSCRTCRSRPGHGPYWYAYWREGSRLHSTYIGKVRPASLDTPPGSSTPESTLETGSDLAREEPDRGEGRNDDLSEQYHTEQLLQGDMLRT